MINQCCCFPLGLSPYPLTRCWISVITQLYRCFLAWACVCVCCIYECIIGFLLKCNIWVSFELNMFTHTICEVKKNKILDAILFTLWKENCMNLVSWWQRWDCGHVTKKYMGLKVQEEPQKNYIFCNDISNEFEKYHCFTTSFFAVLLSANEKNHQFHNFIKQCKTNSVGR